MDDKPLSLDDGAGTSFRRAGAAPVTYGAVSAGTHRSRGLFAFNVSGPN
jgi:hypothetical protein